MSIKKIAAGTLCAVIVLLGGGLAYLSLRQPAQRPASNIVVERTPERLARGKYLFENLADCGGCHSPRNWDRTGAPFIPGQTGAGVEMPPELGLPGQITSSNLTPDIETGLGTWTDGEKIRAIREGVSKDGHTLFPMMPYQSYRNMSDEDVYSLVAYLNSLPPVKHAMRKTKVDFPVNLLIKSTPQPLEGPVPSVSKEDRVKYGEYLVTVGGCMGCHTPADKGKPIEGKRLAGGEPFTVGRHKVLSANITPEMETGIGKWTEEMFLAKFQAYRNVDEQTAPPVTQETFTLMPWKNLSQLPDEDLRAIYAFLRTQPPVVNKVDRHPKI